MLFVEPKIQARGQILHRDGLIRPQKPRQFGTAGSFGLFEQLRRRRLSDGERRFARIAGA
jgi:hypothetical protein